MISDPRVVYVFDAVDDWAASYGDDVLITIWVRSYEAGCKAFNMEREMWVLGEESVWEGQVTLDENCLRAFRRDLLSSCQISVDLVEVLLECDR